jgi:hypothetical protein
LPVNQILDHFINQNITDVRRLRDQIDALTQAFTQNAETVEVETIAALKWQIRSLGDF